MFGASAREWTHGFLLLATYAAAAWFGLRWAMVSGAASPVWPAAGIGLAALLVWGKRLWPAISLGTLIAYQLNDNPNPLWTQLIAGLGNGLATVVAASVHDWVAGEKPKFPGVRETAGLLLASAALTLCSTSAGVGALQLAGAIQPGMLAQVAAGWLFGDWAGAMIVGALLLSWRDGSVMRAPLGERLQLPLAIALTAFVVTFVFTLPSGPRAWLVYPPLVWAALATRVRGASLSLTLLTAISIYGTHRGLGPFGSVPPDVRAGLGLLQQYLVITAATILLLAAIADERRWESKLRRTAEQLVERDGQLALAIEHVPAGIAMYDRDMRYIAASERHRADCGLAGSPVGRLHSDLFPDFPEELRAIHRKVLDEGAEYREEESEIALPDGRTRRLRWGARPWRCADGKIGGLVLFSEDVTERHAAEQRERLLTTEVDHRAKNLLAVVQSVVQLTRAETMAEFKASVEGRIQALARTHSLLADSRWDGVELTRLIEDELAPYALDTRVSMDGPPLRLLPPAAQSLGLILHELVTNAVKYGVLGVLGGRVAIRWGVGERWGGSDQRFILLWIESGGRPTQEPEHRGFGSTLIQASVRNQLHGAVAYEWGDQGVEIKLDIPCDALLRRAPAEDDVASPGDAPDPAAFRKPSSCRVLVLEDEPLIALQLEDSLIEGGCEVVGVASTVEQALEMIEQRRPTAAVLDINLGDVTSFTVADRLTALALPFIFCTGYAGAAAVPDRFAAVPVIRKPFNPRTITAWFIEPSEERAKVGPRHSV
ncbi:MASE1 domain-containing protein [Sphingomonas ginkgonis]|uniref:MASE1 domain-containing protein n=1 Tax=Sphingomonas ginkgonis TaxID=2315330 RepID=UPI00163A30DC|nr:MASE1 domain-containing protein [Sphingomonas ginkgonis]